MAAPAPAPAPVLFQFDERGEIIWSLLGDLVGLSVLREICNSVWLIEHQHLAFELNPKEPVPMALFENTLLDKFRDADQANRDANVIMEEYNHVYIHHAEDVKTPVRFVVVVVVDHSIAFVVLLLFCYLANAVQCKTR